MELGLCANQDNIIVCCPDGFWRKGNVQIVCTTYNIPLCNTYKELIELLDIELSELAFEQSGGFDEIIQSMCDSD